MSILYPKGRDGLAISYRVKEYVIHYSRVVHRKELIVIGSRKIDYVNLLSKNVISNDMITCLFVSFYFLKTSR